MLAVLFFRKLTLSKVRRQLHCERLRSKQAKARIFVCCWGGVAWFVKLLNKKDLASLFFTTLVFLFFHGKVGPSQPPCPPIFLLEQRWGPFL